MSWADALKHHGRSECRHCGTLNPKGTPCRCMKPNHPENTMRQFYITSRAAYGRKGPAAIMTTRTAHAAAQAFAEAFAPGATLGALHAEPTQTDSAGRLMTWHRAELVHDADTPSIAPHVVYIREQIGGFDAPTLTLADLTA